MKEKPYKNLTKSKRTSMKELSEQEDIIITKADKGGAAVIIFGKRRYTTSFLGQRPFSKIPPFLEI